MLFYQKHTKHILKYHPVTAEPPCTIKTIDCVQQTGTRKEAHHPAVLLRAAVRDTALHTLTHHLSACRPTSHLIDRLESYDC